MTEKYIYEIMPIIKNNIYKNNKNFIQKWRKKI